MMRLDALLRAHAFMKVERPPAIWEVDTEDTRFVPLLGEMIAAALSRGAPLAEITLNVSNVVVERDPEGDVPPGEFVAVSIIGVGDWSADGRWLPERPDVATGLLLNLDAQLRCAGAHFAYVRKFPDRGSITIYLKRAGTPTA